MPLIVIDGPSGVGKTTLAKALIELVPGSRLRFWNEIAPLRHSSEFHQLWEDDISALNEGRIVIWEGSWATDAIERIWIRDQKLGVNLSDFLGEWYYGRLSQLSGARIMLTAPSPELVSRRTRSDIHPRLEKIAYENYADRWGWTKLENDYSLAGRVEQLFRIVSLAAIDIPFPLETIPGYCGSLAASAIFVSSADRDEPTGGNGSWLPFSGKHGTKLGSFLGSDAVRFGWAHSHSVPPAILRNAKVLIASDRDAESWCYNYVNCRDLRIIPALRTLFGGVQRDNHENLITDILNDITAMERRNDVNDVNEVIEA